MPIREYACSQCEHEFEKLEQGKRKTARWCPKCGRRTAHRKVSAANAHFKGAGFHANDYAAATGNPHTIKRRTKADNVQRGIERVARRMTQGQEV